MLRLTHRSNLKELLDAENIPAEDLVLNMQELDTINTYLGGHQITIAGFKKLAGKMKTMRILEIGCGGGDNLRVIQSYCRKKGIDVHCMGVDLNLHIVAYARIHHPDIHFEISDYRNMNLTIKPDIIFSSLFCHHFEDDDLKEQLQWMRLNSRWGFFINDLHRHFLAYYSIQILTRLFSKSYLVKNDAPLSVARGFTKNEWQKLLKEVGMQEARISWRWAFRHLIVYQHKK
jgi:SAM-dependent methyltransferase